jgi:CheY-like chemotaxis protein
MTSDVQRVLLIDHSGTSLAIISKLITKNIPNVKVDAAMNADEAFRLLQQHKYALITTSRNLPDIDCHQMVDKIRKELRIKSTPLIVISGEKMGIYEEQMACSLVNGYFDKKLGQQKLVDYIYSFLNTDPPRALLTGNILYVEDSPTVALATKNLLTKHDYNYLHAVNAEQALQHIQHSFTKDHIQPFDLLLTDIQLEGHMSGRDLIREIRHGLGLGYELLPILVTTSSNFDADPGGLNRIFSSGANDILEKPVREPMLIARLNSLLMLRKQFMEINHPDNSLIMN